MKAHLATLLVGILIGGAVVYNAFPKQNDVIKTEYKDRVITKTRIVKEPGGQVVTEIEKEEDKSGTIAALPPKRLHRIDVSVGHNGAKMGQYGFRAFDNTWLTLGVSDKKEVFAGISVEF